MKKPITEEIAVMRLETLCARSEQCSFDILKRLERWGITSVSAKHILSGLTEAGFVNDERFAKAYVREKYLFSRWGRHKITAGLYAKRINKDTIALALYEIEIHRYAANAFKLLASKLRSLPQDMERSDKRQRLLQFGISRGFETSLIVKVIESKKLWESYRT